MVENESQMEFIMTTPKQWLIFLGRKGSINQ